MYTDNCRLSTAALVTWANGLQRWLDAKAAKELSEQRLQAAFGAAVQDTAVVSFELANLPANSDQK